MATDKVQDRMIANLRGRHTDRIRKDAEDIRETAGWLLTALDRGHEAGHHAQSMLDDAQEIVTRLKQLATLREASEIYEADAGETAST
jgi:hypothetical protein